MIARKLSAVTLGVATLVCISGAQVPDLLTSFEAGGRALGTGGALNPTATDTLATYYNPAGIAYVTAPQLGAAYRNLPKSTTTLSGDADNPRDESTGFRGKSTVTHLGVAFPSERFKGVIGASYTIGGYLSDVSQGTLSLGFGDTVARRIEREAKSEYFTLAFARASADQTSSFGVGLQYVRQYISYFGREQFSNGTPTQTRNDSSTGSGFGLVAGYLFSPRNNPNLSVGVSYRTEIDLSGNSDTADLYDRIPARLLGGFAYRLDGFRGGRDFVILGGQVQHFFSGRNSVTFDRNAQTTAGFGFEYNYALGNARIPLRVGYSIVPGGGDAFGSRNGFAFGFGYRPNDGRYSIDVNFVSPENGGYDVAIGLNYRLGR